MTMFRFKIFGLAAVVAVTALTCAPTEQVDPNLVAAKKELQEGLEELELGAYQSAKMTLGGLIGETEGDQVLEEALAKDTEALNQARMGYVLANSLNQINIWVDNLAKILDAAGTAFAPDGRGLVPQGGGGLIAPILDGMLDDFFIFFKSNTDILDQIKKDAGFQLELSQLPVRFGEFEIMEAGGEYDVGEVYFFDSVYRLIMGVLKTMLAIDFTIKADLPFGYIIDQVGAFETSDNQPQIVMNLIGTFFYSQTRFLELYSKEDMQEAGNLYGQAFGSFLRAIEVMQAETDDQENDIVGYYPAQGGNQQTLVIHVEPKPLPIPGVDTSKLSDIEVQLNERILDSLQNIEDSFNGVPGKRISWKDDLVPLIALASVTLLKTGAFDGLIFSALDAAGGLDEETKNSIRNLISSDVVDASLIEGLILGVIPDVFQFDVGTYFNDPVGPRNFLPFWTEPYVEEITDGTADAKVTDTVTHWEDITLLMEFECDDGDGEDFRFPVADGTTQFLCADPNVPLDLAHFSLTTDPVTSPTIVADIDVPELGDNLKLMGDGATYGWPRDGIKSPLPQFALRDPTLGGILWIKLAPDVVATSNDDALAYYETLPVAVDEWTPADNFVVNALISGLFTDLLNNFL